MDNHLEMPMLRETMVGVVVVCLSGALVGGARAERVAASPEGFVRGVSQGTIDLQWTGIAGDGGSGRVLVNGVQRQSGHILHEVMSGPQTGASFATFCIELRQHVGPGVVTYDIVDLTEAPLPGPQYGPGVGEAISAVIANAIALGWIDGQLQADESQENYLGRMGAIQAALWEATGDSVDINAAETSSFVRSAYLELTDAGTFDPSLRLGGLRALINGSRQDMLYVVPLPPAVFAGAGLLAVGFGVRALRRR
jgi:hypothetical protein